MGIYWTATDAVQPLQFSRRTQVISLYVEIQAAKRKNENDEDRCGRRDNHKRESGFKTVSTDRDKSTG